MSHSKAPKKRPSTPFIPPFLPSKSPKPNPINNNDNNTPISSIASTHNDSSQSTTDKMVKTLADAGCTLVNPNGPPSLPSNPHKLRSRLQSIFSSPSGTSLKADFLEGFYNYIQSHHNFHRVLVGSNRDGMGSVRGWGSLVRQLLLVPLIQVEMQTMLLEKLPEYFDVSSTSMSLNDDVARLIVNHFRWLDFIVDADKFVEKLMEVLSTCPLHLKKEIIGSLPEIVGDQNSKAVIDALEMMLEEDSSIVVSVLDSFANICLDDQLQEQVITIAISCIRTVDAEDMPYLLRFLMLSATTSNVRRIISQIREKLKFVGVSNLSMLNQTKLKGKSNDKNIESLILDALKSSLLFKNNLCQEILKELKSLENARDYKVIDIWLLMLIYMNGNSMQKKIERLFINKIVVGCFENALIDQCIQGNKEVTQDFFRSFVSLSEHLLSCKEQKAREFATHIYISLFKEFNNTYSRQEILGALLTHIGSGVDYEVNSSLETMLLLASEHSHELLPYSSFINGIFDFLEGFNVENLTKVYEVFSLLALTARERADSFGDSISNELMMIVRKQVTNPDLNYKKMGLIGTLKIVSCFGDAKKYTIRPVSSQKSNCEEALELLKVASDSCKHSTSPLILFYDELVAMLNDVSLQPEIMDWIRKHVGDFESLFLSDLVGGLLPTENCFSGLQGELWMNLDGDISPICLKILPLTTSLGRCASSLQILPVNFRLLCFIERTANQGSLGGIDALLGCPLNLPSSKYFTGAEFQCLTGEQKQILCSSLYYAANWIRELINAFSTQVTGRFDCTSQIMKEEILLKLSKRFRNLQYLESLLNSLLQMCPSVLPNVHAETSDFALLKQTSLMGKVNKKMEQQKTDFSSSLSNTRNKELPSKNLEGTSKFKQPTLFDVYTKAGVISSPKTACETSELQSQKGTVQSGDNHKINSDKLFTLEVSEAMKFMEAQIFKFRRLEINSLLVLSVLQSQESCCSDPSAELPLYLYIARDLHYKLNSLTSPKRQSLSKSSITPSCFDKKLAHDISANVSRLFPNFKKQLDGVLHNLKEGTEICEEHWREQSAFAGNPEIPNLACSYSSIVEAFCKEMLHCFTKALSLFDSQRDNQALRHLLECFQPPSMDSHPYICIDIAPLGSVSCMYCGTFSYFEGALNIAYSFSFVLAFEVLLSLKSIVDSAQRILNSVDIIKNTSIEANHGILSSLQSRLADAAQGFLRHHWDDGSHESGSKSKGDIVQRTLNIYLNSSETMPDLLEQLACNTLPQVPTTRSSVPGEDLGFPTLCSNTLAVWYRVLNEQNIAALIKLVKEIVHCKSGTCAQVETIEKLLARLQQLVNVEVSLVNMCRSHNRVNLHAMAVKFGGKYIDSFLKVFDFLQEQFSMHSAPILKLVTELQKATRTIQTICSEAKGFKLTSITSNVPATKRSLERFIFRVKALLHDAPNSWSFSMGILKHKNLAGEVVSSQVYLEQTNDADINLSEDSAENPDHAAEEDGGGTGDDV